MDKSELDSLAKYAERLNHAGGNLFTLSELERSHLPKLMRKFKLEGDLHEVEEKLSQLPLNLEVKPHESVS